jgi:hypothetical protein
MSRRSPLTLAVSVVIAGALVGACGTPRSDPSVSASEQPISIMPMANPFVSAVMHMRGLGSAAVDVEADYHLDGTDSRRTGVGAVDLGRGFGNVLWTDADGSEREIVNDVAVFVQSDGPDSPWTRLPEGVVRPTTPLNAPLAGLGAIEDPTWGGTETIDGRMVTRYDGRLPADPVSLAALGLTAAQVSRLGVSVGDATVAVSAWVDSANRIVRVDRSLDVPDGTDAARVRVSTRLSDFSRNIDVAPPPSQSVTNAPTGT